MIPPSQVHGAGGIDVVVHAASNIHAGQMLPLRQADITGGIDFIVPAAPDGVTPGEHD